MNNLLCSVSFGLSSVATAIHIMTNPKYRNYNILYAFANTSKELEETLRFGHEVSKDIPITWIEGTYPMIKGKGIGYKIISFENAKRNGEVFKAMIKKANIPTKSGNKVGLPNVATPYCSDRLKKIPLHKLAKDYFKGEPYKTAIGFRKEDVEVSRRITYAEIRASEKYIYPLITDFKQPLSQKEVKEVVNSCGYYLQIPSKYGNCDGCFKRSKRKQIEMIRNGVLNTEWWRQQEVEFNDFWYRGNASILDLIKNSKEPRTLELFDDYGEACLCGT